jgi:hypothetical protein
MQSEPHRYLEQFVNPDLTNVYQYNNKKNAKRQ